MHEAVPAGTSFHSDIPDRLDRLPWSSWHWRVLVALGVMWILDGLEVTLVGAVASVLGEPGTLALSESQIGGAASIYLTGALIGSLFFGRLTDVLGRKRLFMVTLVVYLVGTALTAVSWNYASFVAFRFLTGAGLGGEGSAVASALDELLPARVRGRANLAISGSYWLGTALGALTTLVLLDDRIVPHSIGWRLVFFLGAILGLFVLVVRKHLPESPRWLLLHGHVRRAEESVRTIEADVARAIAPAELPASTRTHELTAKGTVTFREVATIVLRHHARRTILGLSLVASQAFAYNAIFFTYALVLSRFYGVPAGSVGLYLLPFAIGNFAGPLVLGRFFDTVGRRPMIASTYAISGILLVVTGFAFQQDWLTAVTQTAMWCAVFFVASAAASAGYLTVSELFPVEIRGLAIALFYAAGTAMGGVLAPTIFGALIESGQRDRVFVGYLIGAGLMLYASVVTIVLGVPAERRSLEELAVRRAALE
jgi:MFS family permease